MNIAELIQAINGSLIETTLAGSAAIALVLLLRRWLRVAFGASVAYASWLLVPAALLAVLLPAATPDSIMAPLVHGIVATPLQLVTAGAQVGVDHAPWLLAVWLLGVICMACNFLRHQHRFRLALGKLRPRDGGLYQADTIIGLPAAIGWFKPIVVLPADFDVRYSAEQRVLMLAHERAHIRHGDLQANAIFVALRCLFWFNPLLHVAARVFRHDQELACDQRVIARHPNSRRAYGEAMFRTQLAAQPLPLGCHWGLTHPLKERIEMLKQTKPSRTRLVGGTCLVLAVAAATGTFAWAAQPARGTVELPSDALQAAAIADATSADTPEGRLTAPAYPRQAIEQKVGGKVVLLIDLDASGRPTHVEVAESQPPGVFDAATIETAYQWRFNPEVRDGKAVPSRVLVPVTFEPDKPEDGSARTPAST